MGDLEDCHNKNIDGVDVTAAKNLLEMGYDCRIIFWSKAGRCRTTKRIINIYVSDLAHVFTYMEINVI